MTHLCLTTAPIDDDYHRGFTTRHRLLSDQKTARFGFAEVMKMKLQVDEIFTFHLIHEAPIYRAFLPFQLLSNAQKLLILIPQSAKIIIYMLFDGLTRLVLSEHRYLQQVDDLDPLCR